MESKISNPPSMYMLIASAVNIRYTLINIVDVCLMFGVICSVLPSAKYSRLRLTDDGTITKSRNMIPKPPNHCIRHLHIEMEYGRCIRHTSKSL